MAFRSSGRGLRRFVPRHVAAIALPAVLTAALVGALAASPQAMAQNAFSSSPHNWENSPYNWRNSPYNWRNSPYNWDASPYNWQNTRNNVANRPTGPNAIADPRQGNGYGVRAPGGALLQFDAAGNRVLPGGPGNSGDSGSDSGNAEEDAGSTWR